MKLILTHAKNADDIVTVDFSRRRIHDGIFGISYVEDRPTGTAQERFEKALTTEYIDYKYDESNSHSLLNHLAIICNNALFEDMKLTHEEQIQLINSWKLIQSKLTITR